MIDDLTPSFTLDKLHETPWERDRREARERDEVLMRPRFKKKKKKRVSRTVLPDRMVPDIGINSEHYKDSVPNVEFDNTVEVPEDLLNMMRRKTGTRTKDISHLMMSRILPTFLGIDAAKSYTVAAMRDALDVEIDIDNSVNEAAKQLANLDLVYYFIRRSTLPKKFKHHFLMTLVEESARSTLEKMAAAMADEAKDKRLADYQALINRATSTVLRSEDRKSRAAKRTRNPSHKRQSEPEVPFAESLLGIEGRTGPALPSEKRRMR